MLRLRQFLSGSGAVSLVEADSILEDVLSAGELESLLSEGRPRWLRRLTQFVPHASPELVPLLLAGLLIGWLLLALLLGRSWWYVLSRLFAVVLVASFFWHWNHLYVRAVAERHLNVNRPQGCDPEERGWSGGLLHYFSAHVSFVPPDAACKEYHLRMQVDPWSAVPPSLALAEMASQFLLHPAERFGAALGRFYVALGAQVPTLWMLPLTVISLVFVLALVVIACRCGGGGGGSTRGTQHGEPLHVAVTAGDETVYLLVTADGQVEPVGEEARRRTRVQSARPERVGWLAWTGRGLARSVSAGALMAGGAVTAGTRALATRALAVRAVPVPAPALGDGNGGGGDIGSGDRMAVSDIAAESSPERPAPAAKPASAKPAADASSARMRQPRSPVTSLPSVSSQLDDDGTAGTSARVPDPAGGGDAGSPTAAAAATTEERRPDKAEVAPRGGGDENLELTTSPFLTRIKEVMDTSLEDIEG